MNLNLRNFEKLIVQFREQIERREKVIKELQNQIERLMKGIDKLIPPHNKKIGK